MSIEEKTIERSDAIVDGLAQTQPHQPQESVESQLDHVATLAESVDREESSPESLELEDAPPPHVESVDATLALGAAEIAPQPVQTTVQDDGEESVQSYMENLLARYSIEPTPGMAAPPQPEATPPQPPSAAAAQEQPPVEAEAVEPRKPVQPPESRDQMANLRELANDTARGAIQNYADGRLIRRAYLRLIVAGASVAASLTFAMVSPGVLTWSLGGSAALAIIAGVVGLSYLRTASSLPG